MNWRERMQKEIKKEDKVEQEEEGYDKEEEVKEDI